MELHPIDAHGSGLALRLNSLTLQLHTLTSKRIPERILFIKAEFLEFSLASLDLVLSFGSNPAIQLLIFVGTCGTVPMPVANL